MKKFQLLLLTITLSIVANSVSTGSISKVPQKKFFGNGTLLGTVRHNGVRSYADIYITDLDEKKIYGHFYYSPKFWKYNDFRFSGLPTNKKLLAIAFAKTHETNQLFFSGATPFTIKGNGSSNITIDLKPILEGKTGMSTGSPTSGSIIGLVSDALSIILHYIEISDNKSAMDKAQLQQADLEKLKKKLYSSADIDSKIDRINLKQVVRKYDLKSFTKYEVKLLRNKIFAQKGYVFKTHKIQQYFESCPWYQNRKKLSNNNKVHDYLSPTDKKNIKLLKEYEKHYSMYHEWWKIITHLEQGNKKEIAKYFEFPFKDWSETWSETQERSLTNRFSCKNEAEFYSKYNVLFSNEEIKRLKEARFETYDDYKDPEDNPSGIYIAPNEYCIYSGKKIYSLTLKNRQLKFTYIPYRP